MITIYNEQSAIPINTKQLKHNAHTILTALNYSDYDLGIQLVTDTQMHKLNKQYRQKDMPTDILSFAYHPTLKAGQRIDPQTEDDKNLGDIIIAPEFVKKDLARWGQDFKTRLNVLLVHGICHLLGYDHINDQDYEIMKAKEDELLALL